MVSMHFFAPTSLDVKLYPGPHMRAWNRARATYDRGELAVNYECTG